MIEPADYLSVDSQDLLMLYFPESQSNGGSERHLHSLDLL